MANWTTNAIALRAQEVPWLMAGVGSAEDLCVRRYGDLSVVSFLTPWRPASRAAVELLVGRLGSGWYGEWYAEDFFGVQRFDGTLVEGEEGLILCTTHEEDELGEFEYGDFRDEPDVGALRRMLGIGASMGACEVIANAHRAAGEQGNSTGAARAAESERGGIHA